MSMQTSIDYGYGFAVPAVTTEAWKKFINKHEEAILKHPQGAKLIDYMNESGDSFDPEGEFEEWAENGLRGFSAVIATVMTEETGVRFSWCPQDECGCEDYIMMLETTPWNYNDVERDLTPKTFNDITLRYREELWGADMPENDYQNQEYCS